MKSQKGLGVVAVMCLLVGPFSWGSMRYQFDCTQGVSSSGGSVSAWTNQGVSGGSAINSGESCPMLSSQIMPGGNTMQVLSFDGIDDYLEFGSDSTLDTLQLTWFIVYKAEGVQADTSLLRSAYTSGATTNATLMWGSYMKTGTDGDVASHSRSSTGGLVQRTNTNTSADNWYIVMGAWTNSTGVRQWVMDATGAITYSGGTASGANATPTGHILSRIGAASTTLPSGFFKGSIAEVRIYNDPWISNTAGNSQLLAREAVANDLYEKYFVIPEPATLTLLGIAAGFMLRKRV